MGQKQSRQSRRGDDEDDPHNTSTIDEENGDASTEIITVSPLSSSSKKNVEDDDTSTEEKNSGPLPLRRFMIMIVLTLIAIIVVSVTAPLVHKSLKKEKPDPGADPDYGETPIKPHTEDTGALPSSQNESGNGSTQMDPHDNDEQEHGEKKNEGEVQEEEGFSGSDFVPKVPFEDVKLPYFDSDVLGGYKNRTEFEEALTEAAKFLVNKVVLQNLGYLTPSPVENLNSNGFTWRVSDQGDVDEDFYDVTDFESNNQELGIDEADLVKADSKYIYAAYSNYILVWDTNGNQVAQAKMPYSVEGEDSSSQGSFGYGIFSGSSFGTFSGHKAHVESLLVVDDYLVVIVSGYGGTQNNTPEDQTILTTYQGTQVRTYKTSSIATTGELIFLGSKDINGKFVDARSVGNQVHIATTSGIDTHTHLTSELARHRHFTGLTDDEYVERVRSKALEQSIPSFVQKLSNELLYADQAGNDVLPDLLRLNRWQSFPGDKNASQAHAIVDSGMFRTGLINSVTFISSLDVTEAPNVDPSRLRRELVTSTSAFLAPGQQTHLYGTTSNLVLATRAWNWDEERQATEEVTHLIVLGVGQGNSKSTSFRSLGTVRGYILNPYSLSIVNNELRVATTIARRWRFQGVPELSSNTVDVGDHYSDKIIVTDRSAGQQDAKVIEDSLTENYITVLDLGDGMMIQERGAVQLGEKDEVITAVRFFDEIAYCITFEQTDPFYVVDLKNVSILGSSKQNGFSNYLHPLNDDKTLLLGIGQNATDEGVVTGFMITIYDTSDPTNPRALAGYTVDDGLGDSHIASTQSTAQWEYKSFRYVDGKLIVPLNIVTYSTEGSTADAARKTVVGSFEGFVVFNVDAESQSITEHMRIPHTTMGCHFCGYLAPRSFVYNGNVLTTEGNIVSSTNLSSKGEQWAFHVAVRGEEARCCY